MGIYFVYRCHYEGPTGRYVKRFGENSLLEWFQSRWRAEADREAAHRLSEQVLGCCVYAFSSLFTEIAERAAPLPRSDEELGRFLRDWAYPEGEIQFQPGAIQAITNDDEIEMAWYLFDDRFLAAHPERASLLVRDDWRLPTSHADGKFEPSTKTHPLYPDRASPGATYMAFLVVRETGCLIELKGAHRIDGVRLPDLCRHLAAVEPGDKRWSPQYLKPYDNWPWELKALRALVAVDASNPSLPDLLERANRVDLESIYDRQEDELRQARMSGKSDDDWHDYWRGSLNATRLDFERLMRAAEESERQKGSDVRSTASVSARDPSRSLIQVGEHVAQVCRHTPHHFGDHQRGAFEQWILFDDLWGAANPTLAQAILRYASRWDVLSD